MCGGDNDMCLKIEVYFQFILIAAFIVDVGRVTFGRGCPKLRFFVYNDLIELSNKILYGKNAGFCIFS